jgi:hypothetical protein
MIDTQTLLDAFAELRRTWDELVTLQPDIATASGTLDTTDLSELKQRVLAHEAALMTFAETVDLST